MAVQRDLVANLGLALVNPRVQDMRQDLALEVGLDAFLERDILRVAQVGVRLVLDGVLRLLLDDRAASSLKVKAA